jgi:hypothetical protein
MTPEALVSRPLFGWFRYDPGAFATIPVLSVTEGTVFI